MTIDEDEELPDNNLQELDSTTTEEEDEDNVNDIPNILHQRHRRTTNAQDPVQVESISLMLPCSIGYEHADRCGITHLIRQELELREGQANEALHNLRYELGHKALLMRTTLRNANSQRTGTRARAEVAKAITKVGQYQKTYLRARRAIRKLTPSMAILARFRPLTMEDMKMPGDWVEENRVGQRSDEMAWFWRLDLDKDVTDGSWMEECESYL